MKEKTPFEKNQENQSNIPSTYRDEWIEMVCDNFVMGGSMSHHYWRLILETLWPPGHDLPGPIVSMKDLRSVINKYRREQGKAGSYGDLARRIRELQGEEGVIGIVKRGGSSYTNYQLVSTDLAPKRDPRTGLVQDEWQNLQDRYGNRCAVCGRSIDEVKRFEPDHKIPRLRGGGDRIENLQPLCNECNNFKSTACRGCQLECLKCPWAFPEKYAPINLSSSNIEKIREAAKQQKKSASDLMNEIIEEYFSQY